MILAVALYFAHVTALQTSAYSIGYGSMQRDLGMTNLQAATGVSLYGWVSYFYPVDIEATCDRMVDRDHRGSLLDRYAWHLYRRSLDVIGHMSQQSWSTDYVISSSDCESLKSF